MGDSYTEEKVAGASSVINEGDSYTEEKVAGASAVINDGETYSSEDKKMDSSNKRLKLSVTCDDLSLLSYSVLTTYNYMYTDCVKQDDIYEEQCFWMTKEIDEMLIETKTNGFTNEKHNTLHKNRKLLASMGGFFSGIVLIISCFVGYKYMTSGGKF